MTKATIWNGDEDDFQNRTLKPIDELQEALKDGADPYDIDGLFEAVTDEDVERLKALIEHERSHPGLFFAEDEYNSDSILHDACSEEVIEYILAMDAHGALINKRNAFGATPLHHAVANGQYDKTRRLLEEGASVELQDDDGWNALHYAVLYKVEEDILELFLDVKGYEECLAMKSNDNQTPLEMAQENGYDKTIREVIARRTKEQISTALEEHLSREQIFQSEQIEGHEATATPKRKRVM